MVNGNNKKSKEKLIDAKKKKHKSPLSLFQIVSLVIPSLGAMFWFGYYINSIYNSRTITNLTIENSEIKRKYENLLYDYNNLQKLKAQSQKPNIVVGGLVGENNGGTIENSSVEGFTVNGVPVKDVGGIAGKNSGKINKSKTKNVKVNTK